MDELQLVGYTADLRYLVFSTGGARFRAAVDGDLLETLNEILELIDPEDAESLGLPRAVAVPEPEPQPEPAAQPEPEREPEPGEQPAEAPGEAAGNGQVERPPWPQPGEGGLAGTLLTRLPQPEPEPEGNGAARDSRLSPRQIQALLRAGHSPRVVAREADTDEAWVRRWLPPIEAERERILQAVQRARMVKARLGPSRDRLGDAVRLNLAARGVEPDDPSVQWSAARGQGEPTWTVTLRYRSRGRPQRALWRFQPESGDLEAVNTLAADVAWTRPGDQRPSRRGRARQAVKKSGRRAAKKTAKAAKRTADRRGRSQRRRD